MGEWSRRRGGTIGLRWGTSFDTLGCYGKWVSSVALRFVFDGEELGIISREFMIPRALYKGI